MNTLTYLKPHLITMFSDKVLDLQTPLLVMEWAGCGNLANQKDLSADEILAILQ